MRVRVGASISPKFSSTQNPCQFSISTDLLTNTHFQSEIDHFKLLIKSFQSPWFISFSSSLSSSPHRRRESKGCVRSTSLPLCSYGKNHSKCPANRPILRTSTTLFHIFAVAFSRLCSSQLKLDAGYYLTLLADNQRCCFIHKYQKTNKLPRCAIVRSELAEAGNPADSYPVSDMKLASKIRGILFYAVTSLSPIIIFIIMLGAHPFVLLLDRYRRKSSSFDCQIWATCTVSPFYEVHFEGLDNLPNPDTPAVYVSNHQSFLDIYTLLTLGRSFKFISKTAIFLIHIIGWAMFLMGTIPLNRMDSKSQLECLKRCVLSDVSLWHMTKRIFKKSQEANISIPTLRPVRFMILTHFETSQLNHESHSYCKSQGSRLSNLELR